ncbi:MAG TPA: nucleoside-diphosphate kinase [Candidatus Brocadiia bacterium]|nr:nucleoside-diphosphate kinase [Candidatus Brocadiia bacterium]
MAEELAYALITPYSLHKSRTGGIIARMLTLLELDLVAVRMYAPGVEFVNRYCATIEEQPSNDPRITGLLTDYVKNNFSRANRYGISNRAMLLLFKGQNAVQQVSGVVGSLTHQFQGDTIRGTFGDFVIRDGNVGYFEPAVLTAPDAETNRKQLRLLADFAAGDGGIVESAVSERTGAGAQTTLVILKPDTFRMHSASAGNIIDRFARTGLYIVGAKVFSMSVAMAREFYGPVRDVLVEKLESPLKKKLAEVFKENLPFAVPQKVLDDLARSLREANANNEYDGIIEFMTGVRPRADMTEEEARRPGRDKCMALLYHGPDAIAKIRDNLGATNPIQARPGTVRWMYGSNVMRNGAHASDSPENAKRERRIIGLLEPETDPDVARIIRENA